MSSSGCLQEPCGQASGGQTLRPLPLGVPRRVMVPTGELKSQTQHPGFESLNSLSSQNSAFGPFINAFQISFSQDTWRNIIYQHCQGFVNLYFNFPKFENIILCSFQIISYQIRDIYLKYLNKYNEYKFPLRVLISLDVFSNIYHMLALVIFHEWVKCWLLIWITHWTSCLNLMGDKILNFIYKCN